MDSKNSLTGGEVPLGLGMAFAQNLNAMKYFSSLSKQQQQQIIDSAHQVKSKQEMQAFVSSLGSKGSAV